MLSEETKTRIEHEVDSRSVAVGVWLYRLTRGRITRLWHRRAIVLTTTGRRSGRPRTVLVQLFHDGAALFVVAANSGLPRPPGWYFNLVAHRVWLVSSMAGGCSSTRNHFPGRRPRTAGIG